MISLNRTSQLRITKLFLDIFFPQPIFLSPRKKNQFTVPRWGWEKNQFIAVSPKRSSISWRGDLQVNRRGPKQNSAEMLEILANWNLLFTLLTVFCCCKLLKTELKKTRFTSLTDAHTVTRCYIFHSRVLLSPLENHRHDFRSKTCEINWCVLMARGVWRYPVYLFLCTVPLRAFTQAEESFRLFLPKRK